MYERILVPVDGSAGANLALRQALGLAVGGRTRLRLAHILDAGLYHGIWREDQAAHRTWRETGQRFLDQAAAVAREVGVEPEVALVETDGRISRAILDEARRWGADLIVVGAHGRHGLEHLALGSTAEGVIREAPVPVLSVREG